MDWESYIFNLLRKSIKTFAEKFNTENGKVLIKICSNAESEFLPFYKVYVGSVDMDEGAHRFTFQAKAMGLNGEDAILDFKQITNNKCDILNKERMVNGYLQMQFAGHYENEGVKEPSLLIVPVDNSLVDLRIFFFR